MSHQGRVIAMSEGRGVVRCGCGWTVRAGSVSDALDAHDSHCWIAEREADHAVEREIEQARMAKERG